MLPVSDAGVFDQLKALVDSEGPHPADPDWRGMLAAIGIVQGQPFNPDTTTRAILQPNRSGDRSGRATGQAAIRVPQLRAATAKQLEYRIERRGGRYRLLHANSGCEIQHLRQCAERDKVFLPGPRRERDTAQRRQPLHGNIPPGIGLRRSTASGHLHSTISITSSSRMKSNASRSERRTKR
jgi:hypothetical protein